MEPGPEGQEDRPAVRSSHATISVPQWSLARKARKTTTWPPVIAAVAPPQWSLARKARKTSGCG